MFPVVVRKSSQPHVPTDVCAFVDDLDADAGTATGELVFVTDDEWRAGTLFVEGGRICWAAARGLARRLTDLLAESAKVDAAVMEALYLKCAERRIPLGEYLVGEGIVSGADLRASLVIHTAESLQELCTLGTRVEWRARSEGGYSPRFTFATTEILSRTFAQEHVQLADDATAELTEAFTDGDWGAAFVRASTRAAPDPIAILGPCPEKVSGLIGLGRWASSSLDVAGCLDEAPFIATVLEQGAVVAWRSGDAVIAGSTSAHGPARLLNRRARARRRSEQNGGL